MAATPIPTASLFPTSPAAKVKPKRVNKAKRIRTMLAKGKTPTEIAKALGVLPQYVYSVRAYEKKNTEKAKGTVINRKPGRPKKTQAQGVQFVPTFFAHKPTLWERIKAKLGFN